MRIRRGLAGRAGTALEIVSTSALVVGVAAAAFHLVNRWLAAPRAPQGELDIVALQYHVLNVAGRTGVEVNDLGGGIVELVGEARSAKEVDRLIGSVTGAQGVEVVLDRLWVRTPRLVS